MNAKVLASASSLGRGAHILRGVHLPIAVGEIAGIISLLACAQASLGDSSGPVGAADWSSSTRVSR